MQKLELRNSLKEIINNIKSREVLEFFGAQGNRNAIELTKIIIDSKSGYDNSVSIEQKKDILKLLDIENKYSTDNMSNLLRTISPMGGQPAMSFLNTPIVRDIYLIHKTLVDSFELIDCLLFSHREIFNNQDNFDAEYIENHGIILFQLIDENEVSLEKLNIVINSLKKLIEIIYLAFERIENEKYQEKPNIIYFDSGSILNIGIKIPKNVGKVLSKIIEEAWDILVDKGLFKLKKKKETIEESLNIFKKIKEAEEKGIIQPEEATKWKKDIANHANKLIFNGTLPQRVLERQDSLSHKQLLIEKSKTSQITFEEKTPLIKEKKLPPLKKDEGDEEKKLE